MTRLRTPFLLIVALTGALALGGCQKNPEATESHSPAASTEKTGPETATAPSTDARTEPAPGGMSTTSPPAENTPPAETPPPQSSMPADK